MNRILSIIVICAILSTVIADYSKDPKIVVNATERKTFNTLDVVRSSDSSRIVILGTKIDLNVFFRRYIKTSDFTKDGQDAAFPLTPLLNCGKDADYSFTSSPSGLVGSYCSSSSGIFINVFKSDANISIDGNVASSNNLLADVNTTGLIFGVNQFFFQDDYFYIVFSAFELVSSSESEESVNYRPKNFYIQGVKASDPKKTAASIPVKGLTKNLDPAVEIFDVKCTSKAGGKQTVLCYVKNGDDITSNVFNLGSNAAQGETTVITDNKTLGYTIEAVFPANGYVLGVVQDTIYENTGFSIDGSATTVSFPTLSNAVVATGHAYKDGFLVIFSTPALLKAPALTYSIFNKNGTATDDTNIKLDNGFLANVISLSDSSLYALIMNVDFSLSIGQIVAKTSSN